MKNIFKSSLLLACGVLMLTACSDDNDSNPTLLKPATFTLNTPAYSTAGIDLQTSQTVNFTWSQPDYGFPAATEYELQISKDGNYTVSVAQAAADETGETMPNYTNIANVYQNCNAAVPATEIANALMQFYKWSDGELPEEVTFYARASAVTKGTEKIYSNNVQVTVKPYYVELSDAPIVLWYMVGDCFVNDKNEGWKNESGGIGKGLTPLLPKVGAEFEKREDIGTRDATVRDVSDQRDFKSFERAETTPNREHVEKPLSRMLVRSVARVDDGAIFEIVGEEFRNSRTHMPYDDRVYPQRLDILRGVEDRFSLCETASSRREIDNVGSKAPSGKTETRSRSRRRADRA